jgi:HptB-dependent secretion and biofilm anti anti-sigma factor
MIESTKQTDGSVTLRIKGRFNFTCYKQFNDAVAGPAAPRYVVDLSGAEYMDSSALGMLLLLRDKVGQDAKRVQIVSGGGQPHDVLQLANFHRLFNVV